MTTHPEFDDVSQGEVLHAENFDRLFRGLVTPVQLDGLRMLVTQFPEEEFNATPDRKTVKPSLGVTCLDCHVNFHTTGQFHQNPDTRPQRDRFRLDTVSLRGLSINRSMARSEAFDPLRTSQSSNNARHISTAIRFER